MINPDAPAFPVPLQDGETIGQRGGHISPNGLTVREHFAAMAMQGILACEFDVEIQAGENQLQAIARCSVAQANALIAELNK